MFWMAELALLKEISILKITLYPEYDFLKANNFVVGNNDVIVKVVPEKGEQYAKTYTLHVERQTYTSLIKNCIGIAMALTIVDVSLTLKSSLAVKNKTKKTKLRLKQSVIKCLLSKIRATLMKKITKPHKA